eukprot:UN18251
MGRISNFRTGNFPPLTLVSFPIIFSEPLDGSYALRKSKHFTIIQYFNFEKDELQAAYKVTLEFEVFHFLASEADMAVT